MFYNVMNKRSKSMEELIVKIVSNLKNNEITEDEAKALLLRLFGTANSFYKRKYKEF